MSDPDNPVFIPFSSMMKDGDPVSLNFRFNNKLVRAPLGMIISKAGILGKMDLLSISDDKSKIIKKGLGWSLEMKNFKTIIFQSKKKIDAVNVTIANKPFLRTKKINHEKIPFGTYFLGLLKSAWLQLNPKFRKRQYDNQLPQYSLEITLEPVISSFAILNGYEGDFLDLNKIQHKEGSLDLVFMQKNGKKQRLPTFLKYNISEIPVTLPGGLPPISNDHNNKFSNHKINPGIIKSRL